MEHRLAMKTKPLWPFLFSLSDYFYNYRQKLMKTVFQTKAEIGSKTIPLSLVYTHIVNYGEYILSL